jgi:hypothetical protein
LLGKAARAAPGSPLDDLVGRSIAAATHSLLDYDQAINSIGTAASLSALRGNLGIGALARTAPVDPIMEQARRASALFDAYPTLRIAKDANALFGLGLSKSVLSAIAGGRAFSSLSPLDAMTIDRMARPGFGVLASLGLGTNGVQGAISDLLSRYGDDDRAPLFGAVAAVPEALDTSEGVEAVVAAIEAAWQRISVQLAITPKTDRITITGLMTFAGLLLALWSAVVAQYSYEASKDSPSKAQIESLRGDISGAGANGAERDRDHNRHIRYLDRVAPLRVEPDGRALVLRVVYPDQLLRVQDTRGAWAFVEVYDYKSDQPITGWISRTRLRRRPY